MLRPLNEKIETKGIELREGKFISSHVMTVEDLLTDLLLVERELKRLTKVKENILSLVQTCNCKNDK